MSGWSLVAVIVAAPIALVVAVLGVAHLGLAGIWLSNRDESPSPIPLLGLVLPVFLVLLALAMEPRWAQVGAFGIAGLGVAGELSLFAAGAVNVLRRRARRPGG